MKGSFVALLVLASASVAAAPDFSGEWETALCYSGKDKPCGSAHFSLLQYGTRICGDHMLYPASAARMNEGLPGSVRGTVEGEAAILLVRSGRNNSLVRGKATRVGDDLQWQALEELEPGEPAGDGLILEKGIMKRVSGKPSKELRAVCGKGS